MALDCDYVPCYTTEIREKKKERKKRNVKDILYSKLDKLRGHLNWTASTSAVHSSGGRQLAFNTKLSCLYTLLLQWTKVHYTALS